jgi:HEAT repeat protein
MSDSNYTPKSDFVWLVANGNAPLDGGALGDANLKTLVGFMKDPDKSNRDWATMALGMYGPDTEEVQRALIAAADDEDVDVRGEAIEALARRNANTARPFVERELSNGHCGYGIFAAASMIADPSLLKLLQPYKRKTDAPWVDSHVQQAIGACKTGVPHW